jgi:hypothetical protein
VEAPVVVPAGGDFREFTLCLFDQVDVLLTFAELVPGLAGCDTGLAPDTTA